MNKIPMTAAGHLLLEEELKHRIQVERPRLIPRIQDAIADDFNLAENSEYQAAKTEQEINEARIAELEDRLARAEVIDVSKLSGDTIKFGATVTLTEEDTGEKKVWQIVGEPEADAHKGKNSVTIYLCDRTKGLTYNPDGSLDIYIQNQAPTGHESNWLPCPPSGLFRINYRIYLPTKDAQNPATLGKYLPPIQTAT